MGALQVPYYGVDSLYLFPRYQTREDYLQATGEEAPPYNSNRAPKHWFDPEAAKSTRRSILYEPVLAFNERGIAVVGADGKPVLDALLLSKEEAAAVNIPPSDKYVEGSDAPEIAFPLRPLEANEELCFQFGGVVAVKNVEVASALEGFNSKDRSLLQAIAKKLGV